MEKTFGQIILELRKSRKETQEEMAGKLNVSPQAVSKWENDSCLPDSALLPVIAQYFDVSVDYLFNNINDTNSGGLLKCVHEYVFAKGQFEGFDEAFSVYSRIHSGLSNNSVRDFPCPAHNSHYNGFSLFDPRGFATLVKREFFESVTQDTLDFGTRMFGILAVPENLKIISCIISQTPIVFTELKEQSAIDEETFRNQLSVLEENGIIHPTESKHKSLGVTYEIDDNHYLGICAIIAALEVFKSSLAGISCYLGKGDYPISLQ